MTPGASPVEGASLPRATEELRGRNRGSYCRGARAVTARATEWLAEIKTEEGKRQVAQSSGHVGVAAAFNTAAVLGARQVVGTKPGARDLLSAPAILEAAKTAVTTMPAQAERFAEYAVLLRAYLREN